MARPRRTSTDSSTRSAERDAPSGAEMGSMYDYLAKIILLGPSGCGKSCILHRYLKDEWRTLSSMTVGVEFASKIVKVGTHGQRKRVKLQLWDTAGTERFRSVSRSYYRGAAGAVLVYDITNQNSLAQLQTFLNDARALASPHLSTVLVGNKRDLDEPGDLTNLMTEPSSLHSTRSEVMPGLNARQRATIDQSREITSALASSWANQNRIPACVEVSALSGDGVEEVFNSLARTILTKIELGEINPDDPMSGIQYGDADYYRYDDGSSIKSGTTIDAYGSTRQRPRRSEGGMLGSVFRLGQSPGTKEGGRCC